MINSITISGNVVAAPRKFGNEEHPGIGFTVASNIPVRKDGKWEEDCLYVSCVMFGNRVKKLADIISKGMSVVVNGQVRPERYTNKDGVLVNTFGVNVSDIQLPPKGKEVNAENYDNVPF